MQKGIVSYNKRIAKNTYKIVFETELKEAFAGQFVSILCLNKTLRRPFSISDFEDGSITCLYRLIGNGTNYIKSLKEGSEIDFIGPLGNGFNISKKRSALLVGAGIGIAPMLFLKKTLLKKDIETFFIQGFKDKEEVIAGADKTVIGGSVLDEIPSLIRKFKPEIIYACGPYIVLKLLYQMTLDYNIDAFVSMEKMMACSIGVCRGCVIPKKSGKNVSVCKDGPVFNAGEILWQ